jgi:adenine-specific DNA-methyltransferase
MMYPRLRLARNLLRDDGVLFISIDDNEVANLQRLCDEVFGEINCIATIIWQKVYAPKNTAQWFSEDHDYILVYSRNKSAWKPQPLPRTEEMEARYSNPDGDVRGPWKAENFTARNRYDAGVFSITCPSGRIIERPPTGRYWVYDEATFKRLDSDNRIWWGADGDNNPAVKRFLSEVSSGRTPQTLWFYKEVGHTQDAKKTLLKYVPFQNTENVLNSVKPVELVQRMLQLAGPADEEAIVLDFFSGSATTAHAVLKQNAEDGGNRRFIGIQIAETLPVAEPNLSSIFEMGTTRIRNVLNEFREQVDGTFEAGQSHPTNGFRILKVDSSNMLDVYYRPDATTPSLLGDHIDNIKEGRTEEDLLFQVLLDWGVDLSLPIGKEEIGGKTVFFVDGNALAACFEDGIDEEFVKELAKRQPLRVVFRDAGYGSDDVKINVEQIFKQLSPGTEVRTL